MLNLYHLRYFCDACRSRNMSAAARVNRVSHSAISQAIRGLETALDQELLVHGKKRFQLTPAGETLFARAEEIFRSVDSLNFLRGSAARELRGPVKIGVSMSIGAGPLGSPLTSFFAKHKGLDPDITLGNSSALERLLASREIELGFGVEDGSFVNFERKLLRRGKFLLVTNGRAAANARFLVGDKGSEVRELLAQVKKTAGARIGRVQGWGLVAHLASLGLGVGLVPDFLLEAYPMLRAASLPKVRLPSYELNVFYRDYEHLSPGAKAFLDFVAP